MCKKTILLERASALAKKNGLFRVDGGGARI
jgi:hypothetical protein